MGEIDMSETVANINSLQQIVFNLFQTNTVKIREDNGVITLFPMDNEGAEAYNPTADWTSEQWARVDDMLRESEAAVAKGRTRDAYEALAELKTKHGI